MNIDDMKTVWSSQDEKPANNISLNVESLENLNDKNSKSVMDKVKAKRIMEAVIFFAIIVSLWGFIANNFTLSAPTISAFTLNVFAIIGFAGCIGQIALISSIDYSGSVSAVQKDIYAIREHSLQVGKLTLLSIPFYMAYVFLGFYIFASVDLFQHLNQSALNIYLISSLAMLPPTIWLYTKLNFSNMHTNWVRWLVGELGGKELVAAADIITSIEEVEAI